MCASNGVPTPCINHATSCSAGLHLQQPGQGSVTCGVPGHGLAPSSQEPNLLDTPSRLLQRSCVMMPCPACRQLPPASGSAAAKGWWPPDRHEPDSWLQRSGSCRRGWGRAARAAGRPSHALPHAPLVKGGLVGLLVHGVINVLIVLPASWACRRGARLVHDALDLLHRLHRQASFSPCQRPEGGGLQGRSLVWGACGPQQPDLCMLARLTESAVKAAMRSAPLQDWGQAAERAGDETSG